MSVRQFGNSCSPKTATGAGHHYPGKRESAIRRSAANVPGGEFRIRERQVAQGVLRPVARECETRLGLHCLHVHEAFETENL